METIQGVEVYPIISLLLFFVFFVAMGVWVFTYDRKSLDHRSQLPLQ